MSNQANKDPDTTRPAAERPRGRPPDLESGTLEQGVLDAAEELFAEYGYASTPIRRIADAAGVTPALVHYYFGTKRQLLHAVLERALEPIAERLASLRDSEPMRAADFVSVLFRLVQDHPGLPRLIVREAMLSGGEFQEFFSRHFAPRLGGALPGLIQAHQARGAIRQDLDSSAAAMAMLSLCLFPFVARAVAEPALGIRYDEAGLEFHRRELEQIISRGMDP